jgi:hypothetical protein
MNTAEFGWLVYGNILLFGHAEAESPNLFKAMLIILIYGYITMVFYALSIMAVLIVLLGLWSQGYFNIENIKKYKEMLLEKQQDDLIAY